MYGWERIESVVETFEEVLNIVMFKFYSSIELTVSHLLRWRFSKFLNITSVYIEDVRWLFQKIRKNKIVRIYRRYSKNLYILDDG